ncbi:MAG: class II aldolase/adducin family protein, partial [Candidatus Kapaibacteriota bacterium]
MDEGYIKFRYEFSEGKLIDESKIQDLQQFRTFLYDLGLIGSFNNISYGNVSKRIEQLSFVISASNTGTFRVLPAEYFVLIKFVDVEKGIVHCVGKFPPSAETITHYAVYSTFHNANYVIHFHNSQIWNKLKHFKPTTPDNAQYGSLDLAKSILSFKDNLDTNICIGTIVLGGHKDGIIVFGSERKDL